MKIFLFRFIACSQTPQKARSGAYPGKPIEDHAKELSPGDFVYIGEKSQRYVCEVKEIFPGEEGSGQEGAALLSLYEWPKSETFHWSDHGSRSCELGFSDIRTLLRPPYVYKVSRSRVGFVFKDLIHLVNYEHAHALEFDGMERYDDYVARKKEEKEESSK